MIACVSVPGIGLQIIALRESRDRGAPLIRISADRPSARVEEVNRAARERGVHAGMRYSQVLGLAPDIYAGVVERGELRAIQERVRAILLRHSPDVEETSFEPAQYWVSLRGLDRLFASPRQWQEAVWAALVEEGIYGHIAFGDARLDAYVKVKMVSAGSPEEQLPRHFDRAWIERQHLALLPLAPVDMEALYTLGIRTVGAFAALSTHQVRTRFARRTVAVHAFIASDSHIPVRGRGEEETIALSHRCEPPLFALPRVIALVESLLNRLMARVISSGQWVKAVEVKLIDEENGEMRERVQAARAGRSVPFFLRLIELRFDGATIRPVAECTITVEAVAPHTEQRVLLEEAAERTTDTFDEERFCQLLVLLQAEYGDGAICRAELRSAHLPEERFAWVAVEPERLRLTPQTNVDTLHLRGHRVRRIYASRRPAPPRVRSRRARAELVSTRWWRGEEVHRAYFHLPSTDGETLWAYREGNGSDEGRWFVQGVFE